MRAAARVGVILAGTSRSVAHDQPQNDFNPRVIVTDQAARQEREAVQNAVAPCPGRAGGVLEQGASQLGEDVPGGRGAVKQGVEIKQ